MDHKTVELLDFIPLDDVGEKPIYFTESEVGWLTVEEQEMAINKLFKEGT